MTPQQSLEVLKHQRSIMPDNHQTAQALNIAIEVMEAWEQLKLFCEHDGTVVNGFRTKDIINSLNRDKPEGK